MKYFLDVDQSSLSKLDSLEDQVIGVSFCACRGKKKLDGFSFPVFRGASEPMLGSWNQTEKKQSLMRLPDSSAAKKRSPMCAFPHSRIRRS